MNKIQIEENNNNNINININVNKKLTEDNNNFKEDLKQKINLPDNDINIDSLEFKNFCNDLSAKLFGNK